MGVLAVDADGQGLLIGWAEDAWAAGRNWPDTVSLPTRTLHRQLPGIARGYDHVVIDTPNDPSRDQAVVAAALRAAELVVIPGAPAALEFERLLRSSSWSTRRKSSPTGCWRSSCSRGCGPPRGPRDGPGGCLRPRACRC